MAEPFKVCPKCGYVWHTRDEFLGDPAIAVLGFMADFQDFEKGSYLFNHYAAGAACNSTLALYVTQFLDLYDGPVYEALQAGGEECRGHCARIEDLERCDAHCRNAVARDIIQVILKIKGSGAGAPQTVS